MAATESNKTLAELFAVGLHRKYFSIIPDKIWPSIQNILTTYEEQITTNQDLHIAHKKAKAAVIDLKKTCDPYHDTDAIIVLIQLERFVDIIPQNGIKIADNSDKWELETESLNTIHNLLRYHRSATELQREIGRKCIHKLYNYIFAHYSLWDKIVDRARYIIQFFSHNEKLTEVIVHSKFLDHLINLLQAYRDGQKNRADILSYLEKNQAEYSYEEEEEADNPHNLFYTIEYIKELLTYLET